MADYSSQTSLQKTFLFVGGGNVSFSGTAPNTYTKNFPYIGAGSLAVSGSATIQKGVNYVGSGSILIVGTAPNTYTKNFPYIGAGSVTVTGTATIQKGIIYVSSGSIPVNGAATTVAIGNVVYLSSGSVSISGLAITAATGAVTYAGSGSIPIIGLATTTKTTLYSYIGSGLLPITGTATSNETNLYTYAGSGSVPIAGTSISTLSFVYVANGLLPITGSADTITSATSITVTVKGSGGDYTSLQSALTGMYALYPNLIANNLQLNIECYASATADRVTSISVPNFVADTTRYLKIYTPPTERHPGWWQNPGAELFYYLRGTSGNSLISLNSQYVVVEGIALLPENGACAIFCNSGATGSKINACLAKAASGALPLYKTSSNVSVVFTNCIAIRTADLYGACFSGVGYGPTFASCTAVGPGIGATTGFTGAYCYNCLAVGCKTSSFSVIYGDYNASDDSNNTIPGGGTHNRIGQTFSFVDAANGNYQLAANDTGAKGFGLTQDYFTTTDIVGTTRTIPWDIGAFKASDIANKFSQPMIFIAT